MNNWPNLKKFTSLIGGRAIFWMALGGLSGLLLTLADLALGALLANLLFVLKLSEFRVNLGYGLDVMVDGPTNFVVSLILLGIGRSILNFSISQCATVSHEMVNIRLKMLAFESVFGPAGRPASIAELQAKFVDHFVRATLFCLNVALLIPFVIQAALLLFAMYRGSVKLALVGTAMLIVVGFGVHRLNRYVRTIADPLPAKWDLLSRRMVQMAQNWPLLTILRMMRAEHGRLKLTLMEISTEVLRANTVANIAAIIPQAAGIVILGGLIFVETRVASFAGMGIITFFYLLMRFVQVLGSLAGVLGNLNNYFSSFKIAFDFVAEAKPEWLTSTSGSALVISPFGRRRGLYEYRSLIHASVAESGPATAAGRTRPPAVEFRGVGFKFGPKGSNLFSQLSFRVPPGGGLAIFGRSGSGKSTLLSLVTGLLEPTEGEVLIDGVKPEIYFNRPEARAGYAGPNPFLIEGSLRENLLYGARRSYSDHEMLSALADVGLSKIHGRDGDALEFRISEMGEGLSTGQKQRLSLARLLLAKPEIVFLDEISSNLDLATEAQIGELIASLFGSVTILMVTHRPALASKIKDRLVFDEEAGFRMDRTQ